MMFPATVVLSTALLVGAVCGAPYYVHGQKRIDTDAPRPTRWDDLDLRGRPGEGKVLLTPPEHITSAGMKFVHEYYGVCTTGWEPVAVIEMPDVYTVSSCCVRGPPGPDLPFCEGVGVAIDKDSLAAIYYFDEGSGMEKRVGGRGAE